MDKTGDDHVKQKINQRHKHVLCIYSQPIIVEQDQKENGGAIRNFEKGK